MKVLLLLIAEDSTRIAMDLLEKHVVSFVFFRGGAPWNYHSLELVGNKSCVVCSGLYRCTVCCNPDINGSINVQEVV